MKKLKSLVITLGILIALTSCKKIEAINTPAKEVANYKSNQQVSDMGQEKKILVFEEQFGSFENQKAIYKFTFQDNKVEISYQYADNEPILEKAELENGKIVQQGCSDCYRINESDLCVPNPETDESDCYAFNKSKSTHSIQEILYPSKSISKNSSKKSFTEIRSLIISGNKNNMIRQLGEPNEEYSAYDFLKKYYHWEPISVYTSERPLGISIYVYDNIDNTNNTILVIYNFNKRQVTDIIYKSDVKSFEDVCVH